MPEDYEPDDDDEEEVDEGTKTVLGRRWNQKWLGCQGRAKWTPRAVGGCVAPSRRGASTQPTRAPAHPLSACFVWLTSCRLGAQIFCEANQIVEFMPCCDFNDYDLFTYSERAMLLAFDFSFVWVAVVLSHMDQVLYEGTGSLTGSGTHKGFRRACRLLSLNGTAHA